MSSFNGAPSGYQRPQFPSLNVQTIYDTTEKRIYTLYFVSDVWRFTVLWTVIVYVLFHLAAVIIALSTHGRRISTWKYLWVLPIIYLFIAGLQAVVTGSIVGAV
jgi:Putative transmembrane protein 170